MLLPAPVVLSGGPVRLEPLALTHAPALLAAAAPEEIWRWLPTAQPRSLDAMADYVEQAVADPARRAFAVVVEGTAQGSTSYLDIDLGVGGLEVGATWYARHLWGTAVNPWCKLLLLSHAFDQLGAQRVLLKTDGLNHRSQAAIAKLGARYDGTLRHHRLRPDGSVRDSAYFSILAAEWPTVHAGLSARVSDRRPEQQS